MIIDIVSDLHGYYPTLEGGDLLIVCGDLTSRDEKYQYATFADWFHSQKYQKKVLVAGNHDMKIQNGDYYFNQDWMGYLCDSGTEFQGLKIWGTPWTAWFPEINPDCAAFTCKDDKTLGKKWALIPEDTDILVTHAPPFGILDECLGIMDDCLGLANFQSVGSKSLLKKVRDIRPQVHCFGHIHESHGKKDMGDTLFINASYVDSNYRPSHNPVRIEL